MRILSIGPFSKERNNTTAHRSDCLKEYASYFEEFDSSFTFNFFQKVIYKLISLGFVLRLPDCSNINAKLLKLLTSKEFDLIWIDKGNIISKNTLNKIRILQPKAKLVHYMIDDFMNPNHKTKQIMETINSYDLYVVNRKVNVTELKNLGCENPYFIFMSYESKFHYPRQISNEDIKRLGGDVGFIGTFEKERADSICFLVNNDINVRVFGNGWDHLKNYSPKLLVEGHGLYNEDFCKAMQCFKINLGFLRKKSRDYHTTRSTEIPACGGFMLAERTEEHLSLFEEGKEAAYFSSNEELLEKCKYYLLHDDERKTIAEAGRERCEISGYSNKEAVKKILKELQLI